MQNHADAKKQFLLAVKEAAKFAFFNLPLATATEENFRQYLTLYEKAESLYRTLAETGAIRKEEQELFGALTETRNIVNRKLAEQYSI